MSFNSSVGWIPWRLAEAECSDIVEAPKSSRLFSGFICNCLNCDYNCDSHAYKLDTLSSKWFSSITWQNALPSEMNAYGSCLSRKGCLDRRIKINQLIRFLEHPGITFRCISVEVNAWIFRFNQVQTMVYKRFIWESKENKKVYLEILITGKLPFFKAWW